MSNHEARLPLGSVCVRMRLFGHAEDELRDVIKPPWPRWMRRLYELESAEHPGRGRPEDGEVDVSAALSALKGRLSHRLELLAWICGQLEQLGWDIGLRGSDLIASKVMVPEMAREALDAAGLAASMAAVCEVDEGGWPVLYAPWELSRQ